MSERAGEAVKYSIVIPVFNEQAVLPILLRRIDSLMDGLDGPAEAIFVDDGSTDCSSIVLEAKARDDRRYRYIGFSRNFGQQMAATAGIEAAAGAAVVVMDADLQDPPEIVHDMIAQWKDGYDVVYAQRVSRDDSAIKRWTANLFYNTLSRLSTVDMPQQVGDFRLIDRKVVEAFRAMPERDRFVRGMFAWLGFRQTAVSFHRPPRAAGETKYSLWKLARLAVKALIGFSNAPLRWGFFLGLAVCAMAGLGGLIALILGSFADGGGWLATLLIVSMLCGINMLLTAVLGLYVSSIHAEVKQRPHFVVDRRVGFDRGAVAAPATDIQDRHPERLSKAG